MWFKLVLMTCFSHSHCWRLVWLLEKWLEGGSGRRWGRSSVSQSLLLGHLCYIHNKLISLYSFHIFKSTNTNLACHLPWHHTIVQASSHSPLPWWWEGHPTTPIEALRSHRCDFCSHQRSETDCSKHCHGQDYHVTAGLQKCLFTKINYIKDAF